MPKDPASTRRHRGRAEGENWSAFETPAAAIITEPSPPGVRAFAVAELPRALGLIADGHGATAIAQTLGAGLVRSVGFGGVRFEIRDERGHYAWLFDDGAEDGASQKSTAGNEPAKNETAEYEPAENETAEYEPIASESARRAEQGPARRFVLSPDERIRVSACWHGGSRPWTGLLGSLAQLVEMAIGTADPRLQAPPPATLHRAMIELEDQLARIADGDLAVLVRGESGTGKEVAARRLQALTGGPFIDLNCAALPRDLLEAELFGVERGVATGVEARPGKFEMAHGGTLFLDEIGDMAADTQAKLLRVLQEGEVFRLGGEKPRPARPRVIAATNRDLRSLLGGKFRADLFHRLCGFESVLPPLRERQADIVNFAAFFLARSLGHRGLSSAGLCPEAARRLRACPWPGNVRQLEREMARAALFLEPGERLQAHHLNVQPTPSSDTELTLADHLAGVEKRILEETLFECGGDATCAAAELGVPRSTFYRRLKDLGLESPT